MTLDQPQRRVVAYVAPLVVYLVGTAIAGRFEGAGYAMAYTAVVLVVAALCLMLRREMVDLRPHFQVLPGLVVGVGGIISWIVLSRLGIEQFVGELLPTFLRPAERPAFVPWEELPREAAMGFLATRIVGLAVLVPVAEELFWRGFLLRWWVDPDWQRVPLGTFTWGSCAGVTLLFAAAHPEWVAAAIYCLLVNGLLYWKHDLWQCVTAHATSNLLLAAYILWTKAWWLW
ncbi:MAG: hypothetical protein KatS3mg111_2074 [Pirellulaceae bacterium]|nr:MAG: hypothetical protein KatS3mg111_2074 [Pirellulaceae bacterium]